uniref:VP2 n=1 Tax=Equine encephalosis virus 3 TaxID=201493 RepID=A0A7U1BC63_9REOV|nr:VP2 [Equine encephalosis virus 3]
MDFRVLVCNDVGGGSSLTDSDLDTYEDEMTIIIRANNQYLMAINEAVSYRDDVDLLGRGLQTSAGTYDQTVWPKDLTHFDLYDPTDQISDVLKKTKVDGETTTTQLTSLRYGKLVKESREIRRKQKEKTWIVRGHYTELQRAEEQFALMCNANQHKDICSRDVTRLVGNRVKIKTLIGEVNMPGWLESSYSLVRESKHLDICGWTRSAFDFYRMGFIYIYEKYKYVQTHTTLSTAIQSAGSQAQTVVARLLSGKFERAKVEMVRTLPIIPKCVGGNDYAVPEGTLYKYLSIYMKILEVSSVAFLEEEKKRITKMVEAHIREEDRSFEKFKATGRSPLLQSINRVLNLRDTILGITRTHREGDLFFFSTSSKLYLVWRNEMGTRRFTADQYADWIMREDSKRLEAHLSDKANFANFLRYWKAIPRELRFQTVYRKDGTRVNGKDLDVHFDRTFNWFREHLCVLIHRGQDREMFSKIIEFTIRTAYDGMIPRCKPEALTSFLKVLAFCMTSVKLDDQFYDTRVEVDDGRDEGLFWECKQSVTEPSRYGIILTSDSMEGCKEYYKKLLIDPEYEAASEKEVLRGEGQDVHSLYPAEEVNDQWIAVPRFIGYSYRLYRSNQERGVKTTYGYAEVLTSPQSQYYRHQVVVTGGCREIRDRFVDRTYSNRLRLPTPAERDGNHPCLVSKLAKTAERGVGSALAFFLGRFFDLDVLIVDLAESALNKPERFPEGFMEALETHYPRYRVELMECLQLWRVRRSLKLREGITLMLLAPANWIVLDITIERALVKFFDIKLSLENIYDTMRAIVDKSKFLEHISSVLRPINRTRDFFSWNAMVILTTLFVPEYLEYPKTVPIFLATATSIVAVPIKMKDYTMGGVAMNVFRYFDTVPPKSLDRELDTEEKGLLLSLKKSYLDKIHWSGSESVMGGIYTPFQSWVGMGCMGVKEKIEILVPTSTPNQSHFVITFGGCESLESDVKAVQAVLDEGKGLGQLDIIINQEGALLISDTLPRVKRYKHLAHSEMLDGCIIRLDAASRFDTYMAAKILN